MGGKAYFTANDVFGAALWVTDGTANGTQIVSGVMGYLDGVVATTDKVFFLAINGLNDLELWVTDGSSTPTMLYVSSGSDTYSLPELVAANNYVVFAADNGVDGREIWKSDGTLGGTAMIQDINTVSKGVGGTYGSDPFGMTAMGSRVLFSASDGTGAEPWITDGTSSGTRKIKDINPYGASMNQPYQDSADSIKSLFSVTASSARAFFFANDDEHGEELWATDGTESGTYLVKDVLPGPNSNSTYEVTSVGEKVFFGTSDFSNSTQYSSQFGNELWTSDGTEAGTYMVRNIAPDGAGSYPNRFKAIGNRLLFSADAYNGRGYQLFITDGSRSTFSNLAQPVRILDTRSGSKVGALDGSGAAYTLQVTGTAGVPYHGVAAVSLNVTAVSTEAGNEGGYVTVYPCGTKPEASNLNFTAGQIIPNAVVAPVSASGTVCFYVYGKAHLLADVSGWLPTGGFTALAKPERLSNTRTLGIAGKVGALDGSGSVYTLQVAGQGGLPSTGIGSVALNVTVVDGLTNDFGGYVTVYPCGTKPEASNLNFTSGQIVPNAVIAPVSADGKVCIYVYGQAHILVDVSGYLAS
jgi:ELWxxDGT repeat protein